jgi:nickel/cobalt transporter (NicO) family protein
MKKPHRIAGVLSALILSLVAVPAAFAHPLGNFTINHYAGIQVSPSKIAIDFVLDMAEIPAFQEIATFDTNGNGKPDPEEIAKYHPAACEAIRSQLELRLDGKPVALQLDSSAVAFPPGAGGLSTLRLTCGLSVAITIPAQRSAIDFADNSYADRIGWREIVVTGDHVALDGKYASTSISQRLTAYPKDMLTDPLNVRSIALGVAPAGGGGTTTAATNPPATMPLLNRNDAFTQLTLLAALLISFVWGALHALTPGHGKTIVGAYLVGSRGTARHAFYLGLTTTITHTAGVIALGFVTLAAARYVVPEKLFPWLSSLSGLLVAAIGIKMFFDRLQKGGFGRGMELPTSHLHTHHDHEHLHHHDKNVHDHVHGNAYHDHGHGPHTVDEHDEHTHEHSPADGGHTHSHLPPGANGEPITWRSLLALGISGGILPCPSALIVLLSAIALGRIAFGLVLVLAFSTGLATVLSGIGILFVYAGRLVQLSPKQGRLLRLIPAASALVITAAGLGITVSAVSQAGWLKF